MPGIVSKHANHNDNDEFSDITTNTTTTTTTTPSSTSSNSSSSTSTWSSYSTDKGYPRPEHFTHPPRDPALLLSLARYVLRGWLRGFLIGFGIKEALALVLSIALRWRKLRTMPRRRLRSILVDDPAMFGLFFGGLVGGFRLTEGALDWIRADEHPAHTAIAGAVSGLAMLFDAHSRRTELSLYILARATAALANSMVARGVLPYWAHADTALFVGVCSVIMWIFFYEDVNFPRSYVNFFRRMEGENSKVSQKLRTLTRHYRPLW